jgi:hypothetical protein
MARCFATDFALPDGPALAVHRHLIVGRGVTRGYFQGRSGPHSPLAERFIASHHCSLSVEIVLSSWQRHATTPTDLSDL